MACLCEGSCPCCFFGEVENHKCNRCKREFCNVCHGIKSGNSHHNVLACDCATKNTQSGAQLDKREFQEILWLVEKKWHPDFLRFIETREASNEFLDYLDSNPDAQRAVGLVMTAQARAFEYIGKILKIHRLVNHYFREKDIQVWLDSPHPLLDNKTPQSLMNDGHADAVLGLLESVRDGTPL